MESWGGGGGGCFTAWKPGVIDWRWKIQGNALKRVLLLLPVMRYILLFIGKNINLSTGEGASHSTILPFFKNLLLKDTHLTYV